MDGWAQVTLDGTSHFVPHFKYRQQQLGDECHTPYSTAYQLLEPMEVFSAFHPMGLDGHLVNNSHLGSESNSSDTGSIWDMVNLQVEDEYLGSPFGPGQTPLSLDERLNRTPPTPSITSMDYGYDEAAHNSVPSGSLVRDLVFSVSALKILIPVLRKISSLGEMAAAVSLQPPLRP
jgi:hypothetical protein